MSNSDQYAPQPGEPLIRFEDAVSFFVAMGTGKRCPVCDTEHWEIPHTQPPEKRCILIGSGLFKDDQAIFNLVISCLKCGLERSHRAEVISDWVSENQGDEVVI